MVSSAGVKPEGPVPGCAAEDMAVPLAVKDLRPLRGAFAVFDREPPARHRQNGAACQGGLPQHAPRRPQAPKRPCGASRPIGRN